MADLGFLWRVGPTLCRPAWKAWERIRFHVLYHAGLAMCLRDRRLRQLPLFSPLLRLSEREGQPRKPRCSLLHFGAVPLQPGKLLGNPMA